MFATIIMDDNKNLNRTSIPNIYVQENNTDEILILIPEFYNELNIRDCSVTLNWIQPSNDIIDNTKGNIKLLDFEEDLYKEKYLQARTPITVTETASAGQVEIFLEIRNPSNNIVMKTGSTFIEVKSHKSITDYVPEETIDLLSDYLIKMQQINNTCNKTLALATEQADKAIQSANLIIELMKIWEEEHT